MPAQPVPTSPCPPADPHAALADIAKRFEVTVAPAPDFVVFDSSDRLQAMLGTGLQPW